MFEAFWFKIPWHITSPDMVSQQWIIPMIQQVINGFLKALKAMKRFSLNLNQDLIQSPLQHLMEFTLQLFKWMDSSNHWSHGHLSESIELFALEQLAIEGSSQQIIALGANGDGLVLEVSTGGLITQTFELGVNFKSVLSGDQIVVTEIEHGNVPGGGLVLYVGTERGLMTLETATGRDDASPSWRFFFDANPSNISNKIDDLRTLNLGATGNPAEVQSLVLDGPNEQNNPTVLWIGTPSDCIN